MIRIAISIIVLALIISCSGNQANIQKAIQVETEMTIAHSDLYSVNGTNGSLSLRLVKGTYSEDWAPGPLAGRNWRGEFRLILSDENGQEISYLDLKDHFGEALVFNDFFEFEFDDYNGDQAIDFTVGQYGTSNVNIYKMFTITPDQQIQEVAIKDQNELWVSGGNRYSVKLEKINDQSFITSHYNNAVGQTIEAIYHWDGNQFVKEDGPSMANNE